ncbi:zinc finger protein 318-like [Betta splendens]|uniref:Zinc finger protein 318-like n=1 Tax=Betta splendens TaxID=158456 RepID=A0A6P7MDE1_BETSP|nr:zinc finger protein 318-like [Betta splendens]
MHHFDRRDAEARLQGVIHADHQACFNNSAGHASGAPDWGALGTYPRYSVNEPHASMGVDDVGWERPSPRAQNHHSKHSSQVDDPDGEPLEIDSDDPELTRKRNELRAIEERIVQKKVAIALKNVEPFVTMTIPGFCDQESSTYEGETLRNRVNVILQQRQSLGILSKVQSPKKSPSLRKESLLQEDHPLKCRVKALMKKRCPDPCVLRTPAKVFDGVSSAKELNNADEGFQRFLSILNKGVDMDLLSRIVNDDSEGLPNIHSERNKPSKSQRSNSGTSRPSPSRDGSGEDRTATRSRERSHNEGVSLPYEDRRKRDGGDTSYGSSRRSKSPMSEKKKKKEEETNLKLDERHEHLQNVLKTLGLDLEVEEMSKLTDRTQERLYGKKHEIRNEQEREQMASSSSSSSSCCSSYSSRSTSRSCSPSPSRHRRSHSSDSSDSRDSKPRLKQGEGHQGKEPPRLGDTEDKASAYPHPSYHAYPPPHPPPGAFSSFPAAPLPPYSQSTSLHSGECSTGSPSYWTYSQGALPAPFYSSGFSNPQSTYQHFPPTKTVYPQNSNFQDHNLLVNPDLSTSVGQSGSTSGARCLQAVGSRPASQRTPYITQLTGTRAKRYRPSRAQRRLDSWRRKQQQLYENRRQEPVPTLRMPKSAQKGEAKPLEELKQLTEEEIKANLRKKLEAFNQMARQKVSQAASSQLLTSVECQDYL